MSKTLSGPKAAFLCDQNLGRLARWLRMLGFDAAFMRKWDRAVIEKATSEGRIFLTRKRSMAREKGCTVVESDHLQEQLSFLNRAFSLHEKIQPFSRCSICNLPLKCVKADDVKNQVPEYVYATHREFARCPGCLRIYWKGTHPDRSLDLFNSSVNASEEK